MRSSANGAACSSAGIEHALARWLDQTRAEAYRPVHGQSARPLFCPRVVRAVASDMADIAALLRSEDSELRGIAQVERLLGDGGSALYGHDADALREELHRIRFLLETRPSVNGTGG